MVQTLLRLGADVNTVAMVSTENLSPFNADHIIFMFLLFSGLLVSSDACSGEPTQGGGEIAPEAQRRLL